MVGEAINCSDGHEVARVLATLSLAESITAEAVAIGTDALYEERPGRMTCATCGRPVG